MISESAMCVFRLLMVDIWVSSYPAVLSNAAVNFLAQGLGIGFLCVCVPISALLLRGSHVNPWAAALFSMLSFPSAS